MLEIKTALQIQKPAAEVFEAIADPAKMTNYFISKSTGRIEGGKNLVWNFPEFNMDVLVRVNKVELDKYISFYWDSGDKQLLVEMNLASGEDNSTLVTVTEKSRENDEAGIKWLKENNLKGNFFYDYHGIFRWIADIFNEKPWKTNK